MTIGKHRIDWTLQPNYASTWIDKNIPLGFFGLFSFFIMLTCITQKLNHQHQETKPKTKLMIKRAKKEGENEKKKHTRKKHIDDPYRSLWADQRAKNWLYLVPRDSPPPTHRPSLHATVYYMLPFALGFGLLRPHEISWGGILLGYTKVRKKKKKEKKNMRTTWSNCKMTLIAYLHHLCRWWSCSFTLLFPLFYFSFSLSLPNYHFTFGWKSG